MVAPETLSVTLNKDVMAKLLVKLTAIGKAAPDPVNCTALAVAVVPEKSVFAIEIALVANALACTDAPMRPTVPALAVPASAVDASNAPLSVKS